MKRCKMDLNLQCLLQKNYKGRKKAKKEKKSGKKQDGLGILNMEKK